MRILNSQNRINDLMSRFVLQVKGSSAMSRTDINRVAETVLIPLFKEVYGFTDLQNLNAEGANFPGIDLGDDSARVAVQVTSETGSEKIQDTLEKFVRHKLYENYDRLIIYILTERPTSYSRRVLAKLDQLVGGRFTFDPARDIQDYRTLLRDISHLQVEQAQRVEDILVANFREPPASPSLDPLAEVRRAIEALPERLADAVASASTVSHGILSPDQRVRVSIRVAPEELTDECRAAVEAVAELKLTSVTLEAEAGLDTRASYRAQLEQSQVYVGIFGCSTGPSTPELDASSLLEEYHCSAGKPRLVYLKDAPGGPAPQLAPLIARVEAEGTASLRRFATASQLAELLKDDIQQVLSERFFLSTARALQAGLGDHLRALREEMERKGAIDRLRLQALVDARLADQPALLVTGEPGAGKTYLLGTLVVCHG
jgi:hypothetical protein